VKTWLPLTSLLLLGACNRSGAADVTLDADAAQRNATAAKTLADIAAADAASRGPAPVVHDREPKRTPSENAVPVTQEQPAPDDQADALTNE
jgi:hypothetical protein